MNFRPVTVSLRDEIAKQAAACRHLFERFVSILKFFTLDHEAH